MFTSTHARGVFTVLSLFSVADFEVETPTEVEGEVRRLDAMWEDAVRSKDVSRIVAFYSDDAYGLFDGKPIIKGKKAVIELWQGIVAKPNYQIQWKPIHIEVAKSLDMAYDVGSLLRTTTDPNGKVVSAAGKYVVVWRREADGKWRVAVDISNPDGS